VTMLRKPLAIALLLVLAVLTLLVPAPRALGEFDDLTNPAK